MSLVSENIINLKEKIKEIALKCGRDHSEIKILAVAKNVKLDAIFDAMDFGIGLIGENRIQEANLRYKEIKKRNPDIKYHMIGHLQTNKINQALEMFDVIESVDSYDLAEALDKRAKKTMEIFLEVNTSGETSKFGIDPSFVLDAANKISKLGNLQITGLMTMGFLSPDHEKTRQCFKLLRQLRNNLNGSGFPKIKYLSMGMTNDFPVAIEEGSDIIRIGSYIFGKRS